MVKTTKNYKKIIKLKDFALLTKLRILFKQY